MSGYPRRFWLVIPLVTLGLLAWLTLTRDGAVAARSYTFPAGAFVIPTDEKQTDVVRALGLIHKVLREGGTIYRIIEPPDVALKTAAQPDGVLYRGGPVLVMASDAAAVTAARAAFPSVTVDTLVQQATSDRVFPVSQPTKILIVQGEYGRTEAVLDEMGIPYTLTQRSAVEAAPDMLSRYDLIVDDCPGWSGEAPSQVAASMRKLVEGGGEIIFTDIALADLTQVFPGVVSVVPNAGGTSDFEFHNVGEFPSQWAGPQTLPIYTESGGYIVDRLLQSEVRNILDSQVYAGSLSRIGGFYFYHGKGIVEGLAFHPQEQAGESRRLTSFIYGNKLVHTSVQLNLPRGYLPWWLWLTPLIPLLMLLAWWLMRRTRRSAPTPPRPAAVTRPPSPPTWTGGQVRRPEPAGKDVTHGQRPH